MAKTIYDAVFRVTANWLRDRGYTVYHSAQGYPVPADGRVDQPDIIALHPDSHALRIYLQRDQGSQISTAAAQARTIYARGWEDVECLLSTGRPHNPAPPAQLF